MIACRTLGRMLAVVVAVVALAWAAAGSQPAETPFVFGLILVGPANDHGWSEAHFTAGRYVEAKLPHAKMLYVDNVNPAAKPGVTVPQLVDDLVSKGAQLVITTSDDFQDGTLEAAAAHPDLPLINVSSDHAWKEGKNYKAPKNYGNLMGRMEYGKALAGYTAALVTETGKIGYLGPLVNNETRRLAAAAWLGARRAWVNVRKKDPKDLQFKVTWIGFWFNIPGQTLDPTKVADDFFNNGYDVVLSGVDTTEALVEAGKMAKAGKRVWALPYDCKDAGKEAEEVCLGVAYFNWGPAYLKAARQVKDGKWAQTWEWNGPDWQDINAPDTSAIGFVKGKALAPERAAQVDAYVRELGAGLPLFQGPLHFQDGSAFLKEGEVATDLQVWYLPQLLQGMEGASR